MVFVFLLLLEVFFVLFNKNRFFFGFRRLFWFAVFSVVRRKVKKKSDCDIWHTRQKKKLRQFMLVWEWMSHVSTEVCSNISNIIFIIVRSFLFCCCRQTWSAQACISHVRCDLTTQLFKKVSPHEWVFLIWNFSCNFIIICSFLSAAICILQINQEKRLNTPKKKLLQKRN